MHNTRLRSRAYCAHTDARPAYMYLRPAKSTWRPVGSGFFSVSDSIDFNFKRILNSPEREHCRKVHIKCVHSAMHHAVVRPGYLQQSTWHPVRSGFFTLSTCPVSDMTADQYQCSSMLYQGSMYVYMYMGYWSSSVRSGCVAPILKMRMRVSVTAAAAQCSGFNDQRQWSNDSGLRKLAQARPTMPCIPLVEDAKRGGGGTRGHRARMVIKTEERERERNFGKRRKQGRGAQVLPIATKIVFPGPCGPVRARLCGWFTCMRIFAVPALTREWWRSRDHAHATTMLHDWVRR